MGAAAAPLAAEAIMAESFAVAAPTMFTAVELAPLAAGAVEAGVGLGALEGLGGLSALGAEFGTAGLLAEAGTNASILNAIGAGSGAAVPALAEGVAQGVTTGGLGMGEAGINQAMVTADQMQAVNSGFSQAELEAMQRGQDMAQNAQNLGQFAEGPGGVAEQEAARNATQELTNQTMSPKAGIEQVTQHPLGSSAERQALFGNTEGAYGLEGYDNRFMPLQQPTGLQAGFEKALNYVKENPFSAASMAYTARNLLKPSEEEEKPEEYNGILKRYKMSPNFQGRYANPQDYQYTPKVYAEGGIASFKSGSKVDFDPTGGSKIAGDYYESMLSEQARNMPPTKSDPGIIYDTDPDTRSLDPVSAAQIRMAKINKRSNIQAQNMKRPTRLGQINLSPPGAKAEESSASVDAARGGIMQSSLGGYAAGGNPRLLRGPGDGMSDNIPATIAGKQPARLADGEFVIPADVVSHLGNGSTEAGAKILHTMMTKVRKERTGNSKQGKQINPRKFVPT